MSARRHVTRGLRFRLTLGYALLFALLLVGVASFSRERLAYTVNSEAHDVLDQEWVAIKGYLHIERLPPKSRLAEHQPCGPYDTRWEYDKNDPDEDFAVERLRRVYVLADAKGCVMEYSTIYQSIGIEKPSEIESAIKSGQPVWKLRHSPHGIPYLTRAGVVYDDKHHSPFYVAVGRPMDESEKILKRYTLMYEVLVPFSLLCGCLLGWFLSSRALRPVMEVAQTAQRITSSNLSLRIPTRAAGDELDYLILTFNRMIERLESSFRQIRQFSTDVSHELRTPITAIRGQLEVALFTAKSVEQYRDATLNSLQDIERLSQIVRALLLLSQAESGQLALQKTRLDLASVVRDIVEQFQIPAEGAHVELSCDLPQECLADVDRIQIERMLSNLLSNAVKFTPAGGEVHVALRRRDHSIEMEVADSGCGIPAEHIPHIFERFYRVPPRQEVSPEPGLGLGLSFVAWIAKAHGGNIRVDSQVGQGTRFTVTLPVALSEPSETAPIPTPALG
ncbi:MAG TPA: ATP-binding protein [Bryobacteraceae bacterium]|nr:ATP-binding protein [Bryobacteraceae bacterium]